MSQAVSSSYHTAIKSENSVQDFFLSDTEAMFNYMSSLEGDFVAGTPTIRRSVCESQDFTLGECPSASMSVTIANPYGDAIQFWSKRGDSGLTNNVWARAGIGVRLLSGSVASTSNKVDITITFNGGATRRVYVNSSGTLYVGSSSTSGYSNAVSLHCRYYSDTSYYVYLGLSNGSVYRMNVTSTTSSMPSRTDITSSLSDMTKRKLKEHGCVVYDGNGFPKQKTVYDTSTTYHSETWEYCPVGVYLMKYPKYNLHSAYIDVTDAMDALSRLDTSLKELADANNLNLNQSADVLVNSICSLRGIPMRQTYTFANSKTAPVTSEMITADITCRQFMKWVGERAGHMWKMDPVGYLVTYFPPHSSGQNSEFNISESLIAAGCEIYNQFIDPPEKLVIYYGDDQTYTSNKPTLTREDYYKIAGNPLFADPAAASPVMPFLTYQDLAFDSYKIVDCMVVAADPSYGYGDIAYIVMTESYMTYIMQETLSFGVRVTAHYEATGNDARPDETAETYSGINTGVASEIANLAEEIGGLSDDISNLSGEVADKATIYVGTTPPAESSLNDGDFWINTANDNAVNQYDATWDTWRPISDGSIANTKSRVYYQNDNPTDPHTGDLWVTLDTGATYIYTSGGQWERTYDQALIQTAVQTASGMITQAQKDIYAGVTQTILVIEQQIRDLATAQDINEMNEKLGELRESFESFVNDNPLFKNFYVREDNSDPNDPAGVHITFEDTNDNNGEIYMDGANIRFIVNGVQQAVMNAYGFMFQYGIITTALQIGTEDDEEGGTWSWVKAPSGHFRLVYKGASGAGSDNKVGTAVVGTAKAG